MKISFNIFCASAALIFLAWIAKMHFVFGGDYLFRIGSSLALLAFTLQIIHVAKNKDDYPAGIKQLFWVNMVCLFVVYTGMMLKVSHLLNTQLEKDFLLDFVGIPAVLVSVLYSFSKAETIMNTTAPTKVLLAKQLLLPWLIFVFSFSFYTLYSVILSYQ